MTTFEKIAFWVLWIAILIVKLPIAIATALMLYIERFVTWTQMRLAEWSGDETVILGANTGIDIVAEASEYYRDEILDLKIES